MNPIPEYREKAALARRLAQAVTDPTVREQLETSAKEYDEMADELEADKSRKK